MAVEHEDSQAVPALHTEICQSASKSVGALVKTFPGVTCFSTNNRLTGSRDLFCMKQPLCNIHVEPPFCIAVETVQFSVLL